MATSVREAGSGGKGNTTEAVGPRRFITKGSPATNQPSEPPINKLDGKAVLDSVKGFGNNWSKETEKAFSVPEELNYMRNEASGSMLFSKELNFGITTVVNALSSGGLEKPKTEYGIAVYEKSATTYLVLVDMRRRIVVRDLRLSLHDTEKSKDWAGFVSAVKDAEKAANENPGSIAVHDGRLRLI